MGIDLFNVTGDKGWGTGLFNAVSGKSGAEAQSAAAEQAIKAQAAEAEKARQFLMQQAAAGQGFVDTGTAQAQGALGQGQTDAMGSLDSASGRLQSLMNGGLQQGFQTDPGYAFRQQQGEQAINRSAAARGGRLGAGTLQALMGFNQDLASQEFGNYANRQIGLTGQLSGLDTTKAGLQQGYGGALASLFSGAGTAKANLGMGAAAGNTGISQGLMGGMGGAVPYAGGAQTAAGNFGAGMIGTAAGKLFDLFTSPGGDK